MRCHHCQTDKMPVKKIKILDLNLCESCEESPKYKLIFKSRVKTEYFLQKEDLKNLEDFESYNVAYRNNPNCVLYKLSDVIKIFCTKHDLDKNDVIGIKNKINELHELKKQKQVERKQKIQENKTIMSNKRKNKLKNALEQYGLQLRDDSKLCQGYIDGSIKDWTIDGIVKRMCQMKYLYDYCDMDDCYVEAYEKQQEEYDDGYFHDCSILDQAESIALEKHGDYPKVWPWLIKN